MLLLDRVRMTIGRHRLASPETRVVAALSGGSDSVALAHLLRELETAGDLRLVGLAHLNHQLRAAADADEEFARQVAASLNLPLVVDKEDVGALAQRQRQSIEHAARTARYAFLERARVQLDADVVALGHTRDDQAETFLLRLLRGAGVRGLASMHPQAGRFIRPLLDCRRSDLKTYLEERRLSFVHDASNDDVSIPRNRVRAELLPFIERRFNPSVVDVLADEADIAREEYRYLEAAADQWWNRHAHQEGSEWALDAEPLCAVPAAVARLVLRRALTGASGGKPVRFADVERAYALARSPGAAFDAPGQHVQRIGGRVVLTGRPPGSKGRPGPRVGPANLFRYSLSIPGEVLLPEVGCRLTAEVADAPVEVADLTGTASAAVVRFDKSTGTLGVRNRRPGDRFRPAGTGHQKKLQDFFVDRKVTRDRRDFIPIVVDASDRIVWVTGHAIDEAFRVTDPAQAVIILRLKAVGGPV